MITRKHAGLVGALAAVLCAASLAAGGLAGAATGDLTYSGCITGETESGAAGTDACEEIDAAIAGGENSGLDRLTSLAASKDGKSLYAASDLDDAVATFSRDKETGELTYEGCITGKTESGPTGTGACEEIGAAATEGEDSGLDDLRSLVVSPNGKSLYAASFIDDAVAWFARSP